MAIRPSAALRRQPDDVRELLGLLRAFRARLGVERLVRLLVRAIVLGALLLIAAAVLNWVLGLGLPRLALGAALLGPPLFAFGMALAWWPSPREAAHAADRRLALHERLATAVELVSKRPDRGGRFDGVQVRDAIESARSLQLPWPTAQRATRRAALGAVVLLVAAVALALVLPFVPRPSFEAPPPTASMQDAAALDGERIVPPEAVDTTGAAAAVVSENVIPGQPPAQSRPQATQAEQETLDRLAEALGQVSATQGAADAIQQGNYASARDQLSTLAEEADQLSDAAKRQLAQALQNAAATGGADRQLAERERQAATALGRSSYSDQRQALRQLADQVERSGARAGSTQMPREASQLQQQAAGSQGQGQAPGQTPNMGTPGGAAQAEQGAGASGAQGGSEASAGDGEGQPGGSGAGSGSTDPLGEAHNRLATSGQLVEVPTKLGAGPGQRPTDGSEEDVGASPDGGRRNVAEAARPQHTGELSPEQNLVPGEQRQVVRGYFR